MVKTNPLFPLLPILLLLVLTGTASCNGAGDSARPPRATNGTMELSGWDFGKYGTVKLDGEWEFYWNRLLSPADFTNSSLPVPTGLIPIPSAWITYKIGGTNLPSDGYATYRLRIHSPNERRLHFRFQDCATSFRAWINGSLVAANGVVGTNRESYRAAKEIIDTGVPNNGTIYEIIVQVANYRYYKGGLWLSTLAGPESAIIRESNRQKGVELFIIGILSIIILYHLGLYFIRPKDRTPLVFSVLCFSILLRTLSTGSYIIQDIFPWFSWSMLIQLEYLMLVIPPPIAIHYTYLLFDRKFPGRLLALFYGIAGLLGASIILTDPAFFTRFVNVYEIYLGITSLVMLAFLVRMSAKGNMLSAIILSGFILVVLTVFNDILYSKLLFTFFGYMVPVGYIGLVFSQSLALSIKFSRAFRDVEDLSRNLDRKVHERTSELNSTLARQGELNNRLLNTAYLLEKEKTELKHRTETMEAELAMARTIQMKMVPALSPDPRIAFFYRSMDQVGGDFFDFIRYPGERIGIFISDVSGHGVPAAFITSMIKSAFSQFGPAITNPAFLLRHLNKVLFDQTSGNFITAFYGILDFRTREFVFANAGHPAPFLLEGRTVKQVETGAKSYPLCMLHNEEMEAAGKEYRNESVFLPEKAKLLLYTDGLTEAVREGDRGDAREDFEACCLEDAIREAGTANVDGFVRGIRERLTEFRGKEGFDDDVCLIGVEV